MSSVNRRFFIFSLLLIFSVSTVFAGTFQNNFFKGAGIGGFSEATLSTEKSSYLEGEIVVINGGGFGGYEDVTLTVENYSESLKENVVLMQWNVFADGKGFITASIPYDSLSSENDRYIIRAVGSKSGASAETLFGGALLAIGVNIEQCANGPLSAPIPCNVSNGNDGYTRGNLIASKSHYREGDFVPIRIVASDLTVGQSYTVTIGYDFTKGGKYATDYLGDYDATESTGNDPCVGVIGCTLASEQNFPIPTDPQVTAGFDGILGNSDDITQVAGSFSCFGCTITAVSNYSLSGSTTGDSSKAITVTFTANQPNVVIAYGSHISTRADWGFANSAINISGSPYHNYIVDFPGANQGNRDLQLSAEAVIFQTKIIIIKDAQPNSCFDFGFSTSGGQVGVGSFFLDDDAGFGCADENTLSNTKVFQDITLFGNTNAVTITESSPAPYNLTNITCVSEAGGGTGTGADDTTNIGLRQARVVLQEGETVTCTFLNSITTAANVSASGKVMDAFGNPISRARVTIQNTSTGEMQTLYTGSFGQYLFENLPAGDFYIVSVSHKRYVFAQETQSLTINDAVENLDFVANLQ